MDSSLIYREHINNCIKNAYCKLKLLYSNRYIKNSNRQLRKTLCDSIILSGFNFCDTVYGSSIDMYTARKIQKVQNSCVRFCCGVRRRQRVRLHLNALNWLTMSNRHKLHSVVLYKKVITYKTPPYLYNTITFPSDIHNLNIRNKNTITPPLYRTATFERSFSYQISKEFNAPSPKLKQLHNIDAFRSKLRTHLFNIQKTTIVD